MGLKKCPKCELNYIRDDQKYCDVCSRKYKSSSNGEAEDLMCIECAERPAMKGKDICALCYKESLRQEHIQNQRKAAGTIAVDDVDLDDVEVPLNDDVPENEIQEISDAFGDDDDLDQDDDFSDEEDDLEQLEFDE